jgi:hypothetical protein
MTEYIFSTILPIHNIEGLRIVKKINIGTILLIYLNLIFLH